MEARRRVEDHVAGRQLHRVRAERVFHDELAAVVVVRVTEKQRRGQIGPYADGRAGDLADGVVHVRAERHADLVAVEERRKDAARDRGRDEQGAALQRRHDQIAEFPRLRTIFRQLTVVFYHG